MTLRTDDSLQGVMPRTLVEVYQCFREPYHDNGANRASFPTLTQG